MLLVIATPQGRQIYDRTKAVEAQPGIKTFTWNAVEDNDHEIHQEHEDEEHGEDSLDLAFEKRSGCDSSRYSQLNNVISEGEPKTICMICRKVMRCKCYYDLDGNFNRCDK